MRKITSLRTAGKKRKRQQQRATDLLLPSAHPIAQDEDDMVTIILDDGTAQAISGKNLEVDMAYNDGIPYLVVRQNKDIIPD